MGSKQKQEYARLLVKCGLNVQPGQNVVIDVDVENQAFAKMVIQEAYAAGAKLAVIRYTDIRADQLRIVNQSAEEIKKVEHWERESIDSYLRENGCHLLLTSSYVGLMDDIGDDKAASYQQRSNELRNVVRHRMTTHQIQWCIAPVPNRLWAKALYPHLDEKDATKAFWKTIYGLVYMDKDEDVVTTWLRHQERLCQVRNKLNDLRLRELHFKTGLGTDLTIGLSQHVRWSGGVDIEGKKSFSANIPTEEVFTSPDKYKVEGKVVASRPLYIAGSVIEDFSLTFNQGKVVAVEAKKNKKLLENLINTDEGSCYLGEVALVESSSAISRSGHLFYNTLLDENASCHLALGKGFAGAIDGARSMPDESWEALHLNVSSIHVDFMFGTDDLEIEAYNEDGIRIRLFENGDFVL